ncbi:C-Jun-amino-terminal kinase-interacting protein 1 [Striga asiatica]|uniref:C-Jun-amino-terminal kinase-interacting protein 1 n=1 Tax=Striga asiatica TaxID=4170 RepID=A0A5A7R363_STRAF|nr:C-Jun-amino-terminal kinase-interacting protein 1 [Striga asiatica]
MHHRFSPFAVGIAIAPPSDHHRCTSVRRLQHSDYCSNQRHPPPSTSGQAIVKNKNSSCNPNHRRAHPASSIWRPKFGRPGRNSPTPMRSDNSGKHNNLPANFDEYKIKHKIDEHKNLK